MPEKKGLEPWQNQEALDKAWEDRLREIENLESRLQLEDEIKQKNPNVNNKEIHERFMFFIGLAIVALIIGYKIYTLVW